MTVRLTNRELDIMAVLWEHGSATVGEVQDRLADDLAYTTVLTILRGLEAKRAVRHEQDGKAYRYFAAVAPEAAGDGPLQRVLDKVYQGSRELMIARLVDDETVSPQELRRIRRMLATRLKEIEE